MIAPQATILLVDDLPSNLHTLSRTLSDEYDLSVATSGMEALHLAERNVPHLILLDVMMPEMDGLETLRRLRASDWGREIPVILVTADDRVETQVCGLELGADDFITKPIVAPILKARVRNVLERHRLQRELIWLANTDELTCAMNRRRFFAQGEAERVRVSRYDQPCGLLMLDIDHFKAVNDEHGHATGDAVLKQFADTISMLLRIPDHFGRIGGEEFAILLPQTDRQGSLNLAERLRQAVASIKLSGEADKPIQITTSIGITQLVASDKRLDDAMQRADAALYAAKSAGRNQVKEVHKQS